MDDNVTRLLQSPRVVAGALLLLWCIAVGAQVVFHDLWRDEAIILATVQAAPTLAAFVTLIADQGHPPLAMMIEYLATVPLRPVTPSAWQLVHFLIALAAAGLIAFSPQIRWRTRAAILLGYYFVFEYAVLSRGYGLMVLGILAVAKMPRLRSANVHLLVKSLLCAVVCNLELSGALAGAALFANEARLLRKDTRPAVQFAGAGIVALSATLSVVGVWIGTRSHGASPAEIAGRIGFLDDALVRAAAANLFPLMTWGTDWWGGFLLSTVPSGVAALILLPLVVLYARHRPFDVVAATLILVGVAAIGAATGATNARHLAAPFIVLVALALRDSRPTPRGARIAVAVVLCTHLLAGAQAVVFHATRSFSHGRDVADWVRQRPARTLIAVQNEALVQPLSTYLERPLLVLDSWEELTFPSRSPAVHSLGAALHRLRSRSPSALALLRHDEGETIFINGQPALVRMRRFVETPTGDDYVAYCFVVDPRCQSGPD